MTAARTPQRAEQTLEARSFCRQDRGTGTAVIMHHETMGDTEPGTETQPELTLFNKTLRTQINSPRPGFIASCISREAVMD